MNLFVFIIAFMFIAMAVFLLSSVKDDPHSVNVMRGSSPEAKVDPPPPTAISASDRFDSIKQKPGPNKRVFGYMVDITAIEYFLLVLMKVAGLKMGLHHFLLGAVLFCLRDSFRGKSIGKAAAGLNVVDENGNPISPLQSFLRNILLYIPLIPIIEYFVMRSDSVGRRLGDRLARTRVIDSGSGGGEGQYLLLSLLVLVLWIPLIFMQMQVVSQPTNGFRRQNSSMQTGLSQ